MRQCRFAATVIIALHCQAASAETRQARFSNAISVAVADFNRDSIPDLAVANFFSGVKVMMGRGDGTFTAGPEITVSGSAVYVTTADFNGDGNADIAVAAGIVSLIYGEGNGSFRPPVTAPVTVPNATSVTAGDLNGDNRPDLVVTSAQSVVAVSLNRGDGTFAPSTTNPILGPFANPLSARIADMNGDGNMDVVVATNAVAQINVFLGRGNGTLVLPSLTSPAARPTAVAIADFNTDGKPDVAAASGAGLSLLPGLGDGRFGTEAPFMLGPGTTLDVISADFNKDGRPDVAIPYRGSSTLFVLLGNGTAVNGTAFQRVLSFTIGNDARSIATADLNRDGNLDLAIANGLDNTVSILLGRGDGSFTSAATLRGDEGAPPPGPTNPPNDALLFAATPMGGVSIDLATRAIYGRFGLGDVFSVGVSPAGDRVYFGQNNTGVYTFAATTADGVLPAPNLPAGPFPPQAIAVTPDGQKVYVAGARLLRVFDVATQRSIADISSGPGRGRFVLSPDGKRGYLSIGEQISVIDTETNQIVGGMQTANAVGLAVSPDGKFVYSGNTFDAPGGICNVPDAPLLQVFETATFQKVREVRPGGQSCLDYVALSPDGRRIYMAGFDNRVQVFDATSYERIQVVQIPDFGITNDIAVPGDGAKVYAGMTRGLAVIDSSTFAVETINLGMSLVQLAVRPLAPVIREGSVLNAATLKPLVSPGSIAAVFGSDLSRGVMQSGATPLATTLLQTEAFFDNIRAPLYYVSASQVNAQVPFEVKGPTAKFRLERNGLKGAEVDVSVAEAAPGVFVVVHGATGEPVTAANPAQADEVVVLFMTGLGALNEAVATGAAAAGPIESVIRPRVTVDGAEAAVLYAGVTPGIPGLNQINAQIPANPTRGAQVPLTVSAPSGEHTVAIAIR